MTVKGDVNRKWCSDPKYRSNFDRIFGKRDTGDNEDGRCDTDEQDEATEIQSGPESKRTESVPNTDAAR